MVSTRHWLCGFAVAMCMSAVVSAQDLGMKAKPQDKPILITGATVHPVSSPAIENGVVMFDAGKLTIIGPASVLDTVRLSDSVVRIDATGKHVYPGLIGANTLTGLVEIGAARATIDYAETGDITPEVRAAVAVNPDSTIIPVTRLNGVLTVGVLPIGGAIPGRASVIRMDGWTWEDLAVKADAGLIVNWPNLRPIRAWWMEKSEEDQIADNRKALAVIEESFDAASAYIAAREVDSSIPTDLRWEAMRGVLQKGDPVFIRANELEQIQSAVSFASKRDLNIVIVGGRDAPLCADLLKLHAVPVMVTGTHHMPRRRDSAYDEAFTLPKRLQDAGVSWCFASNGGAFETPNERNLPYQAATAVAYGLGVDDAIRSITLSAAEVLEVDDELGSLDAGKNATLIITSGNPLEITSKVERAFIDGREIDLTSKQTILAEKYREKYRRQNINRDNAPKPGS